MGDVKKDVELLERQNADGAVSLQIAFALDNALIKLFEERIKKENPGISLRALRNRIQEELFYGRKDNP